MIKLWDWGLQLKGKLSFFVFFSSDSFCLIASHIIKSNEFSEYFWLDTAYNDNPRHSLEIITLYSKPVSLPHSQPRFWQWCTCLYCELPWPADHHPRLIHRGHNDKMIGSRGTLAYGILDGGGFQSNLKFLWKLTTCFVVYIFVCLTNHNFYSNLSTTSLYLENKGIVFKAHLVCTAWV